MNDNFEVHVKWDNGEQDVVYITDLSFDKTLRVYFVSDNSWTAEVIQIYDWNDFEGLWDRDKTKNSVTTTDVSPLNLPSFLGERVKWRDDMQIEGIIVKIGNQSISTTESELEASATWSRNYVGDESDTSDSSSSDSMTEVSSEEDASSPCAEPEPEVQATNLVENRSGLMRWASVVNAQVPDCNYCPIKENIYKVASPYQYFLEYFNEQFCEKVCELSNLYLRQKNPNSKFVLNQMLLKQYAGIIIMTTVIRLGATKRYWRENTRIDLIANKVVLPNKSKRSRTAKFQMIIDQFNYTAGAYEMEENLSIDEQIIGYKGKKSSLRQYNPKKPQKWME